LTDQDIDTWSRGILLDDLKVERRSGLEMRREVELDEIRRNPRGDLARTSIQDRPDLCGWRAPLTWVLIAVIVAPVSINAVVITGVPP
jgi:hypothetical protein